MRQTTPAVGLACAYEFSMLNNSTTNTENHNNMTDEEETENMNTATDTTITDPDIALIEQNLSIIKEHAKEVDAQIAVLESRVRSARGTGDVTEQARAATQIAARQPEARQQPKPVQKARPRDLVEQVLRGHSMSTSQISKATGISVGKVSDALKALRVEEKIANVGTEDFPSWTYRIGDKTPTKDLNEEVKRLVSERPMTTQELISITGARLPRVSGALVNLQRTEQQLLNMGTSRRARWFLVGPRVTISRLPPKSANDQ